MLEVNLRRCLSKLGATKFSFWKNGLVNSGFHFSCTFLFAATYTFLAFKIRLQCASCYFRCHTLSRVSVFVIFTSFRPMAARLRRFPSATSHNRMSAAGIHGTVNLIFCFIKEYRTSPAHVCTPVIKISWCWPINMTRLHHCGRGIRGWRVSMPKQSARICLWVKQLRADGNGKS